MRQAIDYIIGCDLGQASDPTALAVLRRAMLLTADGLPTRDHRGQPRFRFDVLHLARYPLGTSYPDVVAKVEALVERTELAPRPRLAIDATGVGRAVVDMFLDVRMDAEICPVTLTAGREVRRARWNQSSVIGYWVPKNETIGVTQTLLQTERLKIAKGLALAETLKRELLDFRMKITASANETFNAREGAHDDILLAVAIGCWLGVRREIHYRTDDPSDAGTAALDEERKREAEALRREQDAERERRERAWMSPLNDALWAPF